MPIVKVNKKNIAKVAEIIKAGGVVAFPTETVYGLGANTFDAQAVKKIFALKGRPSDNPLIIHIGNLEDLGRVAELEIASSVHLLAMANTLLKRFWPGPLTLVLPKKKEVPYEVTAGLETVAVRMPSHPVASHLIHLAGVPIAAPSANKSGRPSPTSAVHVAEDFGDELFILDGGKTKIGLESTVLDLTASPPVILRAGAVTLEMILDILPDVILGKGDAEAPKSPGMKYRHYAPKAKLILIGGEGERVIADIQYFINSHSDLKIGVLASREYAVRYSGARIVILGSRHRLDLCARNLFSKLREFDKLGVDVILAESFSEEGIGAALMERLKKASGSNHK